MSKDNFEKKGLQKIKSRKQGETEKERNISHMFTTSSLTFNFSNSWFLIKFSFVLENFDNDGSIDIAVVNYGTGSINIILNCPPV